MIASPGRITLCSFTIGGDYERRQNARADLAQGAHAEITAFRNGTLQGAYYLLALRAVGLDCGAMSGFDNDKVDAAFFPDGRLKSNFIVIIGHGSGKDIPPRNPRLSFEELCRFV